MISVLRKIAQLNIKYRKKWGPHNQCLHRAAPDKITGLCPVESYLFVFVFILVT